MPVCAVIPSSSGKRLIQLSLLEGSAIRNRFRTSGKRIPVGTHRDAVEPGRVPRHTNSQEAYLSKIQDKVAPLIGQAGR